METDGAGTEMPQSTPGTVLSTDKDSLLISCGQGALRVLELQMEGKKRMSARDFLLGVRLEPGEVLG